MYIQNQLANTAKRERKKPFWQEPVCASAILYMCTQNPPRQEVKKRERARGTGASCSEAEELFLSFIH